MWLFAAIFSLEKGDAFSILELYKHYYYYEYRKIYFGIVFLMLQQFFSFSYLEMFYF